MKLNFRPVNLMATGLVLGVIVVQCDSTPPQQPAAREEKREVLPVSDSVPTETIEEELVPEENEEEKLPECTKRDCNCSDFQTQAEAQKVLEAFADDPYNLDKNNDGKACESLG